MSLKTVRLRSSCAVLFVLAATALPSMQPACAAEGLPPLIDRELLFGDPEISGAQISPDGQFISFLKPFEGVRNIWVKRTAEPFERARPVTADTARPISSYFWSLDAKYLLYSQDRGGDENYNVYAVAPYDPPAAGKKVPPSRNLTDVRNVQAQIYTLPKAEPDVVYVGLNDRDQAWHDLYRVRISNGERTLLRRNDERITSWTFDLTARLRLATRSAENGDTEVLRVDKDRFTRIYNCTVFESCDPVQFHTDGRRVYLATNKGAEANLTRLVLLDVSSAREELVEADPKNRVDLGGTIFSRKTGRARRHCVP